MNTIIDIKKNLMDEIQKLEQNKNNYVNQPGEDFSRMRKISFSNVISSLISMEAGSIRSELIEYFSCNPDMPTTSAFIQQRDKISHHAFRNLFYSFTSTLNPKPSASSCNYYAVDGSKVKIPMLDELSFPQKSVFIFDRGYEVYALMAHISSKNQYYVIRAKDRKNGGIIKGIQLPDTDEFDIVNDKIFVHRMNKSYKETKEFPMKFRVIRLRLDNGSYEYLLTKLPSDEFDINALKEIYHRRWGIETSFRYLKYTIGLTSFHSKKLMLSNRKYGQGLIAIKDLL